MVAATMKSVSILCLLLAASATASKSACDVVRPDLPKECKCSEPGALSFVLECDVVFNDKFFNDTIGIKADVEPCKDPADISLDITGTNRHDREIP